MSMSTNEPNSDYRHLQRRGYPLSALFVLVAICGILLAQVTPIVRAVIQGEVGVTETIVAALAGGVLVMCLGVLVGMYHYRRWRGIGLGALTGALIGVTTGPLALVPADKSLGILAAAVGGAVVLLAIGVALRLASTN